eukprot:1158918-Pelagomonas_calceolata.AAC.1
MESQRGSEELPFLNEQQSKGKWQDCSPKEENPSPALVPYRAQPVLALNGLCYGTGVSTRVASHKLLKPQNNP